MRMLPDVRCVVWMALVAGLAACAAAPEPAPGASSGSGASAQAEPLAGSSWTLTELDGRPPVPAPAAVPTLQFDAREARANGNTGCNLYNGPYAQDGDALRLGPLASTRRACTDDAANRQETAFLQALGSTTRFTRAAGVLVLYAGDQAVARFRTAAP
jgi:heat shock protein HslJ